MEWYDGSSFQTCDPKYYDGSSWLNPNSVKVWNGSSWNEVWASSVLLDFEDGNLDGWTNNHGGWNISSDSYEGSYSAYMTEAGNSWDDNTYTVYGSGKGASKITFYWKETSNQSGFAFSVYNSNGNREFSMGSNNPQWTTDDANGEDNNFYSGDGYDRWIKFEITPDWSNSTYTLAGEDMQSGSTDTYNGNMYHGVDLSMIAVGYADGAWSGNSKYTWIDNILIE